MPPTTPPPTTRPTTRPSTRGTTSSRGRALPAAALGLAGALLLAACGGGEPTAGPSPSASSSPVPGLSPSATAGTPTTAGASPGSTAPTGPAATGSRPSASSSSGAPAPRPSAVAPSAAGRVDTAKATAAGTYTYDDDGTVTVAGAPQDADGTSTLVVDPASGGAQHSVLQSEQSRTEQDLLLRAKGSYVARLQITNPAFDLAFEPDPAALLIPDPADVGVTWSWTATATDGSATAQQSSRVVRKETLTIGGKKVETRVIATTLVVTGDDLDYRATQTTWYAPSAHLPVKSRQQGKGTYQGFPFEADVTSVLRSTTPA